VLANSIPKAPKFKEIASPSGISSINQHITPVKASKGLISYAMFTPSNEDILTPPSVVNQQQLPKPVAVIIQPNFGGDETPSLDSDTQLLQ
jgi:hypothetical protein